MLSNEVNKGIDHIRKDMASLREDLESLTSSLRRVATKRGRAAADQLEDFGERARAKAVDWRDDAEQGIGEHPFVTVAASFGLGLALGMLLDRRH